MEDLNKWLFATGRVGWNEKAIVYRLPEAQSLF